MYPQPEQPAVRPGPSPDGPTMDAALYGTAYARTAEALRDAGRIMKVLAARRDAALKGLTDAELNRAMVLERERSDLVRSELPLTDGDGALRYGLTDGDAKIITTLRRVLRCGLACDMAGGWRSSIERRARTVGAAEHAVRLHASGAADRTWANAVGHAAGREEGP